MVPKHAGFEHEVILLFADDSKSSAYGESPDLPKSLEILARRGCKMTCAKN